MLYTADMKLCAGLYLIAAAVALLASGISGCGNRAANHAARGMRQLISLQILDYDGIQKLIASHRGQVVVMDCWSTACPPCVEEFPKLVALSQKYNPDQLACISLSFDFEGIGKPEDVERGVREFLSSHHASFENVLGAEPSDTLLKKMNLPSIPAVFVYDRDGTEHRFEGTKAYDEAGLLVKKLISDQLTSGQ
ncbi:MAG TPA: TlpA disulfide reductase family protein [Pirellulales bacterium]|jgi:thiol-disulfide isomerase/thioredoxin|nr:TlpA disulfide reductase family protein [Pirellulales bacterium]